MGVKNLWDILDSCKKTLPLHHLQNKRFCIDLSCWIIQLQNASKSPAFAKEKCYLSSLFHRLRALIALNCSLIFVTVMNEEVGRLSMNGIRCGGFVSPKAPKNTKYFLGTVFYGSIPAIKLSTYRRRLGSGNEVTQDKSNLSGLSALPRNKGSGFSSMIKEAKLLGMALGIPCLNGLDKRLPWLHNECLIVDGLTGPSVEDGSNQQSRSDMSHAQLCMYKSVGHLVYREVNPTMMIRIEEAEAQCALLNFESLCDGCFTADSDVFLFGARTVYRDIYLGEGGYVLCYEMADIERKLGFGRNSLISLALLLGGDYSQGVHGIGQETACQIVKSMGDNLVLQQIASEGFAIVKKTKGTKKQGLVIKGNADKENCLDKQNVNGSDHQFLQVIDAYLKPKCHSPDSAAVQSVLIPHPFQRSQLQMVCAQFFGWTPEKTDEYILPKIAERDLRRFANLRNTSHELGVQIPLCKIPAKCPVSVVVQKRKVQGRECFEVAWEEVDGLITSTVPADLVESACPEKIVEYMERRDETKQQKRKRKPNKLTKKHQVHSPSIESDGHNASMGLHTVSPSEETNLIDLSTPSPPIRACKTTKCQEPLASGLHEQLEGLLLGRESQSIDMPDATVCHPLIGPSSAESEVIDLSTPLPPSHVCIKSGKAVSQSMDVTDLSELESDASPEHLRKARELRLFLNSIKDDLC